MVDRYRCELTDLDMGATMGVLIVPTCKHKDFEATLKAAREIKALVDAAPELLAALKAILPWHDSHPVEATDNPLINQCRAAIAKATAP